MEKIKSFKELKIWQKGIEIVGDIYRFSKEFPQHEIYGLTAQIKRAAISIPSNIAEGFKRSHSKEFRQFLHIALGSLAELETQTIIANQQGFLDADNLSILSEKFDHLSRMICILEKKLK